MRSRSSSLVLLFFAGPGVLPLDGQSAGRDDASNLVTHSEVSIDGSAARVWPHILDPSAWKQGAALWHHAGPAGEPGEVFGAGDPGNKAAVAFFAEVVELVPNQRRTLKLYLPSGVLLGFATWRVQESGGRTRVEYDVYSEFLRPPFTSVAARDSARRADLDFARANQRRFDQELVALKRLVESDRSR